MSYKHSVLALLFYIKVHSSLSLILYSSRGLGSEIVEDTVDSGNLCDDALYKVVDQLIGQVLNRDFHNIGRIDGTDDARPVEGALAVSSS